MISLKTTQQSDFINYAPFCSNHFAVNFIKLGSAPSPISRLIPRHTSYGLNSAP